ncbi:MAG: hypothetical protein IT193_12270 [Propionibacteriaceae bacterium]|nr:hypothetical protein [Propionibacteriaceae bacterium]
MNAGFSEQRSTAIRAGLVAEVAAPRRQRPHWWRAVGLLTVGVLAGAGATSAAFAAGGVAPIAHPAATPTASTSDGLITAPPGVVPGTPIISLLGSPRSLVVDGSSSMDVSTGPEAATHVRVTVTCLTAGTTTFGTDAGGNNASFNCEEADLADSHGPSWQDFEITSSRGRLYFTTSEAAKAAVSVQFVNQVPTRFGVNANGETFGAINDIQGQPDLVWMSGTDNTGQNIVGYGRSADLDAFSPDHPGQPTNPAEAVRLQAERDQKYPNGWDFPLYESDGETQIGTFHIG